MAIARPVTKTIISTVDFGIPVVDQLNANTTDIATLKPGPWINMTFTNGWSNFDPVGYDPLSYRKVGDIVQIRGCVRGGTVGQPIATLPVGYRPSKTLAFPVASVGAANPSIAPSGSFNQSGQILIYDTVATPNFVHLGFYQFCTI